MSRQQKRVRRRQGEENSVEGAVEAEEDQVVQKLEGAEGRQRAEVSRVKRAPTNQDEDGEGAEEASGESNDPAGDAECSGSK